MKRPFKCLLTVHELHKFLSPLELPQRCLSVQSLREKGKYLFVDRLIRVRCLDVGCVEINCRSRSLNVFKNSLKFVKCSTDKLSKKKIQLKMNQTEMSLGWQGSKTIFKLELAKKLSALTSLHYLHYTAISVSRALTRAGKLSYT